MVVLVFLGLASPSQAHLSQSLTVNDRIARIRAAAREQAATPDVQETASGVKLAQWGNWPNWGNWGNWYNWGNWGNWGNL